MAKEKFERNKPHVNVGTIGHVDHGKTTLTAALTRVCAEAFGGERKTLLRSTTPLKSASVVSPSQLHTLNMILQTRHYAHVDCPGHADYVKNMITGAAQMDGAILGMWLQLMAQCLRLVSTSFLSRQVGVPYIVVFLNKSDLLLKMGGALKNTLRC